MSKTVLFQVIQFSISTQFSSVRPKDRTLSGATFLGQSESGSDGNEGVLRIPQSSSIIGASLSYFLCHIQETHWGRSYPSSEVQSVYSTAPANCANKHKVNI